MKTHEETHSDNPYRILLAQLTSANSLRPRLPVTRNVWRKDARAAIEKETRKRAEEQKISVTRLAPVREKVVRDMFDALSAQEKARHEKKAKDGHEAALKKWDAEMKGPPSKNSADRQRCIQGLTQFMPPILDGITECTGWNFTLIGGGPEPASEGCLTMLSIHSGTTSDETKMNFGRAEHVDYEKYFVPTFARFLHKCFSIEECRSRTLSSGDDFLSIKDITLTMDESAEVHTLPGVFTAPTICASSPVAAAVDLASQHSQSLLSPTAFIHARSPSSRPPSPNMDSRNTPPPQYVLLSHVLVHHLRRTFFAPDSPQPRVTKTRSAKELDTLQSTPATATVTATPTPTPSTPTPTTSTLTSTDASTPSASLAGATKVTLLKKKRNATHLGTLTEHAAKKTRKMSNGLQPDKISGSSSTYLSSLALADHVHEPHGATPTTNASTKPKPPPDAHLKNSAKAVNSSSSAPDWFKTGLEGLKDESLGPRWVALLKAWSVFEAKESYTEISKLLTEGRPDLIGAWKARRRVMIWRPSVDIHAFEESYRTWWTNLQPSWRVVDGVIDRGLLDGDWESIRRPGLNGLFSVIAALYFWGFALFDEASRKVWQSEVDDCHAVLSRLAA
ncbi:hypothetical protein CPB83DRAFT_911605 [Crepidotus variabilis]|uniref:Uncharacterized protein n=1 Tax=Crepidotus variabilis TaxID=179855 RepID=A0A9P6E3M6_9AGAR|nr:hypothetical protein CPB83DRAFT_911605 [Crepidotus variabilis]